MKAVMLLQKLQDEADRAFETKWEAQNQEVILRNVKPPQTPPSKTDQNRARLIRLRKATAEIENELELERQVEAEFQRNVEARRKRNRKHTPRTMP